MSRLAAAHRALAQLYENKAEATVDYLLVEAAYVAFTSMRYFYYSDPLGGRWVLVEPWLPEAMGGRRQTLLLE